MSVLITGGAGYIGSHVARLLSHQRQRIVIVDNLSSGHRETVPEGATFVEGDIADDALMQATMRAHQCTAIVHFAARIQVGESVTQPLPYFRDNAAKTWSLIESARACGIQQIVFSSTAAVYGTPVRVPIAEEHTLSPVSPYGTSKRMVEEALWACEQAYGIRAVMLRYFNASGAWHEEGLGEAHDPETHLIPIALDVAMGKRKAMHVFGLDYATPDGSCVRDYIHVRDLATAHVAALKYLQSGGKTRAFNVGTQHGSSVLEVLAAVERTTGCVVPRVVGDRREGDPAVLVADAAAIQRELGWAPAFSSIDRIVADAWAFHRRRAGIVRG